MYKNDLRVIGLVGILAALVYRYKVYKSFKAADLERLQRQINLLVDQL